MDDPFTSAPPKALDIAQQLAECLAEFRRLGNMTVVDSRERAKCHRMADQLLTLFPKLDNPDERYNAPHRVEHRQFVSRMFERN